MRYIAYGSNLLASQMLRRCPHARLVGTGFITGMRFEFSGRLLDAKATLVHAPRGIPTTKIPIAVWEITPEDEQTLDRYEGAPFVYHKEKMRVTMLGGKRVTGLIYLMNGRSRGIPSQAYLGRIAQGYRELGFADYIEPVLKQAVHASITKLNLSLKSRRAPT